MGVWSLRDYGLVQVLSTNRSESWNALIKREFVKKRGYSEDEVIMTSFSVIERRMLRLLNAKYRIGEKWKIRDKLKSKYNFQEHLDDDTFQEKKKQDDPQVVFCSILYFIYIVI